MIEKLKALEATVKKHLAEANTVNEVNEKKAFYLGKKSPLQELMMKIKDLSNDEKREFGIAINKFKTLVSEEVTKRLEFLSELAINLKLNSEAVDVTLPGRKFREGSMHPLMAITEEIEDLFIGMGYKIEERPEVESDLYNFEML